MTALSSAELTDSEPRILFMSFGDLNNDRGFPGAARGLLEALERAGVVHAKGNVLGYTDPFRVRPPHWLRIARRLDRVGLERWYQSSTWSLARNTGRARRLADRNPGYNACFMFGTHYVPHFDVPTYCCFDATTAQVSKAVAWEFNSLAQESVDVVRNNQAHILEQCTGIFPWSQWAANSVVDDYGIERNKITVLGAGANLEGDIPPHDSYGRRNILFVGAEFERKGGPLIVEAFGKAREQLPDATLTIIGCSPEVSGPGIEVVGRIDKHAPGGLERIRDYYRRASIFCMMSEFEPLGIVILEAGLCGVASVCPRRFAFPEMIKDGETGRLTEGYDADELAGVFVELLSDEQRLAEMGARARAHVLQEWTWDAAAERVITRIRTDIEGRA